MKAVSAKLLLLSGLFVLVTLETHALNPTPGLPSKPGDRKTVPIDGGISLLLAAGIGLSAGKYFMGKKEKSE